MRYAASRARISHASWSRIERGLQAADNRFVLADIAGALECSPIDITGTPVPSADRQAMAAQAGVYAIFQALADADIAEPADHPARSVPELRRELRLVRELRHACDYAGAARLLPGLLREFHAASQGPRRMDVLRLFCDATFLASSLLRSLGNPAEAWLGAERCQQVAQESGDPVLLGYAAFARASAALSCGSQPRALALAGRAVEDLDEHTGAPGALEAIGTLQLLCGYANRGLKRPDESARWTDAAGETARHTGETTTLDLFFGPANVKLWRITIEIDGGEPGRAMEIAKEVDRTAIPVNSRLVYFHTDIASACARIRGRETEAVRHLLTAERIAPQHVHCSSLVQETVRALLERAQRQAGGTALRALGERMRVTG